MKILFLANIPSPYRVDFFNELGKNCDLTVVFEGRTATDRDDKWKSDNFKNFKHIFLNGFRINNDKFICLNVLKILKTDYDYIILGGYSTPTLMLAIQYLKLKRMPFYLEVDGGLISKDSKIKYKIKKHFISSAYGWMASGEIAKNYLCYYGADRSKIYSYSFTSLKSKDILNTLPGENEKAILRKKLGMKNNKIILSVGRFTYNNGYGKGFDILLDTMTMLNEDYSLYIVGDKPTQEFIELKQKLKLKNVYFEGFKTKDELKEYYKAADLFCLQTRGDVWGLVINEAMSNGLPIITSDKCVAGLELVDEGGNGFIVPVDDVETLAAKIDLILKDDRLRKIMALNSLKIIKNYTIENMANEHINILRG